MTATVLAVYPEATKYGRTVWRVNVRRADVIRSSVFNTEAEARAFAASPDQR